MAKPGHGERRLPYLGPLGDHTEPLISSIHWTSTRMLHLLQRTSAGAFADRWDVVPCTNDLLSLRLSGDRWFLRYRFRRQLSPIAIRRTGYRLQSRPPNSGRKRCTTSANAQMFTGEANHVLIQTNAPIDALAVENFLRTGAFLASVMRDITTASPTPFAGFCSPTSM